MLSRAEQTQAHSKRNGSRWPQTHKHPELHGQAAASTTRCPKAGSPPFNRVPGTKAYGERLRSGYSLAPFLVLSHTDPVWGPTQPWDLDQADKIIPVFTVQNTGSGNERNLPEVISE